MLASRTSERVLVVVLVVLVAAIGVVIVTSSGGSPHLSGTRSEFDGPTLPPHLRAADFSLLDQNGRRVSLSQYRGKVVVLTFIHSLCKDTCPFMVEQVKGALNELPHAGRNVPAIGVSVEPSQDTRAHRREFLAKHEMTGRMAFLSGPLSSMTKVWHAYAIQPVHGLIDHSTVVLLIDKRGFERVGFFASELTPDDLAHDIRALEREPA
jgi:cytochrome oxidase Cu insertion factor (SCO1/SenC/PrrC family)